MLCFRDYIVIVALNYITESFSYAWLMGRGFLSVAAIGRYVVELLGKEDTLEVSFNVKRSFFTFIQLKD